jgi:hypothetical protein
MYANRTTFAATTAVMAANVELPGMQEVVKRVARCGRYRYLREGDAPFHMYFSDAKYDAIGMMPRERLKATSLSSTPVLWEWNLSWM